MKNVKRLLMSVIALVMIFSMVFTMSACDQTTENGTQDGGTPENEWGADVQITPGQNGYGGEGKIQITFKLTYANQTTTGLVTVNASSATVQAFVRDFLKTKVGNMSFGDLFPYGVWELNGSVMSINDILVTLRNGDVLHLKLHTMPEAMGGSGGTADGTVDFDNPDQIWGADFTPTPEQNGYGAAGEITVGFKVMYQGETDDAVIVVKAQSITLEALIRDYLDGPLGGMTFSEILPYGSWYLNGQMMDVNGAATVLKNHDVITLSMRTLPGDDDSGDSGNPGNPGNPGAPDGKPVKIEIMNSDGSHPLNYYVTSSSGTERLDIILHAAGYNMEKLLELGIAIEVNGDEITSPSHPIKGGDHVFVNVQGTELDTGGGSSRPQGQTTTRYAVLWANGSVEGESRSINGTKTLAEYAEDYMGIDFEVSLRYGKWRVDGIDVTNGNTQVKGGSTIMFRQNGRNGSDDWGDEVKIKVNANDVGVSVRTVRVSEDGMNLAEFYRVYLSGILQVDLDEMLDQNYAYISIDEATVRNGFQIEDYTVYPDSVVYMYFYNVPTEKEEIFNEVLMDSFYPQIYLYFSDGTIESISERTRNFGTVSSVFDDTGYSFAYYAQYGYFLDQDDQPITANTLINVDGVIVWHQTTPFPEVDLSGSSGDDGGNPDDFDFSIKLGFRFEDQFKEETVWFAKDGYTLDKFIMTYLSEEYFGGMDYNNLSKCGSWYFENKLCTRDTKITDGGYLEFRITTMPDDGSFDDLFDTTIPERMMSITVDASALYKELPPITVSVPVGTTFEAAIKYALEKYGYSYEDTLEADGAWQLPGIVLKDGDTLTYVKGGGTVTPPVIVPDEFLIQFTETYPNTEITGISLSVKRKMGETITLREFAEEYVLDRLNMTFEQSLEEGVWYIDGNRALSERLLFKSCTVEFRRNTDDLPGGGNDGTTQQQITVYILNVDSNGVTNRQPYTVDLGTTLAELVGMVSGMSYDEMIEMGHFAVNGAPVDNGYTYVLREGEEILFVPDDNSGGDTEQMILVFFTSIFDGHPETVEVELRAGSTLYDLANLYTMWGYEGSLAYGYWMLNDERIVTPDTVLSGGDKVEFVFDDGDIGGGDIGGGDIGGDPQTITVYVNSVDAEGRPITVPMTFSFGTGFMEFFNENSNVSYKEMTLIGYYTINGDRLDDEEAYSYVLQDGDVIAFVLNGDEGGDDECAHEWDSESGTCVKCWEPCPVDHAVDAIYAPCHVCGFAGFAGGGFEHRMIAIYLNGELYTYVTVSYMPGEYPTLDDALGLTDLGLFADLAEDYVILSNEREAEFGNGRNKLYYDTEIYINSRPEEIPPSAYYTVYYTKFYEGDSWQRAMKFSSWTVMEGTFVFDALSALGADIWENDRVFINGTHVSDWREMTVEGDTYVVILDASIPDQRIVATVVNELTGKTRTVTYEAPVYFSMVCDNLIGELADGMTYNVTVENGDWGMGVVEFAIAYNFTVTISEKSTNVSIKVVDDNGNLSVMNQSIKGMLPTVGDFIKTYLGGNADDYYVASVEGGMLRELSADDTVPEYWGYIIPKSQIKSEITITYDMMHKEYGQITGSVTVKSPVLLYDAFRETENAWQIEGILWESWRYAIYVDGVELSEEDKGGSFLLLWKDCTLTAKPTYTVRIEYMEYMGDIPMIDPIQVSDPDLTLGEVLDMMGVDTSMFIIERDLSMRIGEMAYGEEIVIYARPKTIRFELSVMDMNGSEMWHTLEGFVDSATLEDVMRKFSEMFGAIAEDYIWSMKDPMTGELTVLSDLGYTWYYTEENGGYVSLILESKATQVWVSIMDSNWNMIFSGDFFCEKGTTVAELLAELGYPVPLDQIMSINSPEFGNISLDFVIERFMSLEIMIVGGENENGGNNGENVKPIETFAVTFEGITQVFSAPISLYDFICMNAPHLLYSDVVWYVDGMMIESIYDYQISHSCTIFFEGKTVMMGFEVWYEGISYWFEQPISLYDFICMNAPHLLYSNVVWYVDGMMIESIYDYQISYSCTVYCENVVEEIKGFEVRYNGEVYWLEKPMRLYDFVRKYLKGDFDLSGSYGFWEVDGTVVEPREYYLEYSCTLNYIYLTTDV